MTSPHDDDDDNDHDNNRHPLLSSRPNVVKNTKTRKARNGNSEKSTTKVVNYFFTELELKLEWLEGVSKNLGGQAPQIFLTLPQAIPT